MSIGGWIECDLNSKLAPGLLSRKGKTRAEAFARLANDVYPSETGRNRGQAALVMNWIELLESSAEKTLFLKRADIRSALGRIFGFNAALYRLQSPPDDCWVLSFEGSASLAVNSPRGAVRAFQDWVLTNLPTTFDVLNKAEAWGGGLFSKLLNPRNAPSTQYDIADLVTREAVKLKGKDTLVLTGHSLGGGLAQYAALQNDLRAVVFNSAGIGFRFASTIRDATHTSTICHLLTTEDRVAFAKLGQIAAGYGMQATGAATVVSNPFMAVQGVQSFNIGKELSKQPMPNLGAMSDQIINNIVTTYTNPLSRHFGSNYVLGIGGHGMAEVLRVLKL